MNATQTLMASSMKLTSALRTVSLLSLALFLGLLTTEANSATLNVVGGQLNGAQDVNIDGTLYDVEFIDGTCVVLFSGCNNALEDFAFTSETTASSAAQALLDQVFLDIPLLGNFDTDPELTRGVEASNVGQAWIPYGLTAGVIDMIITANTSNNTDQFAPSSSGDPNFNTLVGLNVTYAVFSQSIPPVPLPAAFPLLGGALSLLGFLGWRRKRMAAA